MGWREDIQAKMKSLYGVRPEELKEGLPQNQRQQNGIGEDLYRDMGSVWQFMPVQLGGVQLWHPVMRATGRKTIVETPLVERGGSVKEIIAIDDWAISIRGTIKNQKGQWPYDELQQLLDLYQRNEAVSIVSALTSRLLNGNEYVVIKNLDLPDNPGFEESVFYEMECVADMPFELELE